MKRTTLLALAALATAVTPAWALPYLKIESAPIWTDAGSADANPVLGPFTTAYEENFPIPSRTLSITNTGPLIDFAPAIPPTLVGNDFFIKTQVGDFGAPPDKQLVINLEGASTAGQGGMIDLITNIWAADEAQAIPVGKTLWNDYLRVGAYNIPFDVAPIVLTGSRIQNYILMDNHDPATENLGAGWNNIVNGDGTLPVIQSHFDAEGLDIWFDIDGGIYGADALEDSGLRMATFYRGADPKLDGGGGGGNGGAPIPEPATVSLLMMSLAGLALSRRRRALSDSRHPSHPALLETSRAANSGASKAMGMAERAGFEPAVRFPVHTLSRRAPSTTRSPLREEARF